MTIETGLDRLLEAEPPSGFDPRRAPVWLWTLDGARVRWASRAALVVSGARRLETLTGQVFGGATPAVARMAELGRQLTREAPPRLERLRFFFGGRSEMLTCLVKVVALRAGGNGLLVAAMGLRVVVPEWMADHAGALGETAADAETPDAEGSALVATPETGSAELAPPARPAWLDEPPEARKAVRFTWASDLDGRITALSPSFTETTGIPASAGIGRFWHEVLPLAEVSDAARLAHFLSMNETLNSAQVSWRPAGTTLVTPVNVSGVPTFDMERVFGGFRGFGVFRLDRTEEGPLARTPPAAAADVPEREAEPPPPEPERLAPVFNEPQRNSLPEPGATVIEESSARAHTPDPPPRETPQPLAAIVEGSQSVDGDGRMLINGQDTAEPAPAPWATPVQAPVPEPLTASLPIRELKTVIAAQFGTSKVGPVRLGGSPNSLAPSPQPIDPFPPDREDSAGMGPESVEFASAETARAQALSQTLSQTERQAFREIAQTLAPRFAQEAVARRDAAEPSFGPVVRPTSEASTVSGAASFAVDILERLTVAILVLGGDEPLFANRALLDLSGYATFADFKRDDGAAKLFQGRLGAMLTNAGPLVIVSDRAGDKIPVEARVQTLDWAGRMATLMSFRRAVEVEDGATRATLAEESAAFRGEADEARAILDIATDGIATLDRRGRILGLNRSAEALFGFDQNEIAGEPFTLLLSPESHPAANEYLELSRSASDAAGESREVMGRERKGGRMPLSMTVGRLGSERDARFAIVLRDLTAWKVAETELVDARRLAERANAQKSDLLAKVSHEIRTPLNAIIGFAELMTEERLGPVGNDRYKEYLSDIHASGRHVMSLINDLLDLSKIEAGRMELTFTSVDLNGVIAGCISLMQPQANRDRVIMRSHLSQKLPRVVADERSIRQIVLNLLSNATKFTDAGGQVIVSTTLTDRGEAAVRVRDTGVGMSEGDMEQAMEPFRRVPTTHPKSGTGLGLPLTKALAEANRARLNLKSKLNEGTLVELTFPAARLLAE